MKINIVIIVLCLIGIVSSICFGIAMITDNTRLWKLFLIGMFIGIVGIQIGKFKFKEEIL